MTTLQYLDFELMIEREGQQYQATVLRSPVGEGSCIFALPFSDLEVENFVLRLGATRRGTRRISSPEMQHARRFGSRLFEAVFRGDVRAGFVSSQHEAARRGLGLRLKLRLDEPELINLPWEYLYDDSVGRFLSLFEDTPIVRYVDMRGNIVPLSVSPPLSVLVMISRPSDHQFLDVDREKDNLQSALSGLVDAGLLTVTMVDRATLPSLADSLLRGRYHVFHYIGHGGFDERTQDGVLILEDEGGRGRLTSGERLAVLLGNHPSLRLVLLNACEGARTSRDDPFAGTATTLVRTGGVPAVVAMQFPISDEAAITFARGFYTALSVGRPVDASVTQARLAIFADDNDVEWGTPVLYMRAPDGRIFDVESLTPEVLDARQREAEAAKVEREAAERQARELQQAHLNDLYERATALLERADWGTAQEVLAEIQSLEPDYRDVDLLVEQAQSGAKQQEQCAMLYRTAQGDLDAGRLPEAIAGFRSVLDLDATHGRAARQLAVAQAEAERREAEERAQREAKARQEAALAEFYDRASERMEAGDWPEAERLLREIQETERDYRDVEVRLAHVTSERQRLEQLAVLYLEAEEAFGQADWERAGTLYGQVAALKPGYRDVQARTAEVQSRQQLAERFRQALAHLDARCWREAIEGFEAIVEVDQDYGDPVHGSVTGLLARARQEKERAGLPTPPAGKQRKRTSMPEEVKPRDKPKDLPA